MTPYHESDGDTGELHIPPHLQVDPEKVSLPEVQAYLRDRGIDLTDALQRVRAAVAEARRRNKEEGQQE